MTVEELFKIIKDELDSGRDKDQILDYLQVKYKISSGDDIESESERISRIQDEIAELEAQAEDSIEKSDLVNLKEFISNKSKRFKDFIVWTLANDSRLDFGMYLTNTYEITEIVLKKNLLNHAVNVTIKDKISEKETLYIIAYEDLLDKIQESSDFDILVHLK
jgi:hypothetical protein